MQEAGCKSYRPPTLHYLIKSVDNVNYNIVYRFIYYLIVCP